MGVAKLLLLLRESVEWVVDAVLGLAKVGGEYAGDVTEVDLALGAVHLEQLAFVEIVVVDYVWVILQDELVVALLADHLQRLPSANYVCLPAGTIESQHPRFGSSV